MTNKSITAALVASVCVIAVATSAHAQQRQFNIPAGSLKAALDAYGRQSGRPIIYRSEEVSGAKSRGYKGVAEPDPALTAILAETGFTYRATSSGAIAITAGEEKAGGVAASNESVDIVVTGTRVKGAPTPSPVITITQAQMQAAGQNTIADVFQSIPENFNGGQNPGVLLGATLGNTANSNGSGGSSLNLRGLGPDATLTMLNGRRLAYNGSSQAVDVSVIPAAALDRIEIVTDGASAIYGADAVAGVANIILKKDYAGVTTSARWGTSSDGGDTQQQYSVVGGTRWNGGGFIATYDHLKSTVIYSDQRDYTKSLSTPYTLLPPAQHDAFVLSFHQDIGGIARFSIDALYGRNKSDSIYTTVTSSRQISNDREYSISPQIVFALPANWQITLNGTYGNDRANRTAQVITPATGVITSNIASCYCNDVRSAEASAEGPLLALPGGDVRAVVGAGYRKTTFHYTTPTVYRQADQSNKFGYFEAYFPIVGEAQNIPFARNISFTAAGRYESYDDLGDIFTPKFGAIYEIVKGIQIKGSWGRSFKAPTLNQQATPTSASLNRASTSGGVGYPATATVLYVYGGNPNLKPERAQTWTATLQLDPLFANELHASISYFKTRYTDKIVSPFSTSLFLSTPAYAPYLTYNPTVSQQQAAIAGAPAGLVNSAGSPYVPSNVVAIADGRYINAAKQNLDGIDLAISYRIPVGDASVTITNNTSYLRGTRQNDDNQPAVAIAGMVNYPASWRSRGGLSWRSGRYHIAAFANYTSGITDTSITPAFTTSSMTTFDLIASFSTSQSNGILKDLRVSASVINLFNRKPPYLYRLYSYLAAYDSTNYSPVGRYMGINVTESW